MLSVCIREGEQVIQRRSDEPEDALVLAVHLLAVRVRVLDRGQDGSVEKVGGQDREPVTRETVGEVLDRLVEPPPGVQQQDRWALSRWR